MQKLQTFSPEELRLLVCGEQSPSWSRSDLLSYTEPKFGYTKERYDSAAGVCLGSSTASTCRHDHQCFIYLGGYVNMSVTIIINAMLYNINVQLCVWAL